MSQEPFKTPDYLFETGWEVCNKVGGIYTVISTKAYTLTQRFGDKYIAIGPDLGHDNKSQNIEFEEDPSMFKQWRTIMLKEEGMRLRMGRWKSVKGSPIVMLVDFASYISRKDEILKKLWEDYKVDSISGGWDYIEPVLFGYAAARAIESFVAFNCKIHDRVVAQFHEWMSCSGALYLHKYTPSVATVFTTHATVLGRSIAGNGLHLYNDLESFNPEELSHRFGVRAKHSLESIAASNCDCFTTVSQITSRECKYLLGKEADIITPNGFEENMVWDRETMAEKRASSRKLMIEVAEMILGKKFEKEPFIVATSGRYEYKNKGLDEYIDSLALLKDDASLGRDILAYIMVPGWNLGPRKDLQAALAGEPFNAETHVFKNLTHYIGDNDNDAVINHLRKSALVDGNRVNVVFVPAYLNGVDGIFNKHYYDLLPGFDATIFPSYYEPWGYTPLESIAFGVPSVTTSLAGFGCWVKEHSENHEGVCVIDRNDFDDDSVRESIASVIRGYLSQNDDQLNALREAAMRLSHTALWKNLIQNYYNAFDKAMNESEINNDRFISDGGEVHEQAVYLKQQVALESSPSWTRVLIERRLPERLRPLDELSYNMWWSWTLEARELFESIDPKLWLEFERNPIALLDNLTTDRLAELEKDSSFLAHMDAVYAMFKDYMSKKAEAKGTKIAYFSMEYGIHSSLKIYSGGLGILAGDYLKEASDKNIPMVALGLLYRYGYFTQKISSSGEQEAGYEPQNFFKLPITPVRGGGGEWVSIRLDYPGREVKARLWRCDVGRTELYLLDTDDTANQHEDRTITYHLYGGDWENRLKQEILLGIGGIKVLDALGITADVYHCNEGHAAFIGLRRAADLIESKGLSFSEALEVVRASSLFTTHTPVPAGHDSFPEDMIRQYLNTMPDRLKITWEQFLSLGKRNPEDHEERFSMSHLACIMSQEVNGVSWLHGEVSKDILGDIWPGYFKQELHIGYVTNGVHYQTWTASVMQDIYNKYMGESLASHYYDQSIWKGIRNVPDKELWDARMILKEKLVKHIKRKVKNPNHYRFESPSQMVKILEQLSSDKLTIGFARRFATYKRAYLLFTNLERLSAIVNNPERPVQFVFAGKAHPNDKPGQDLIKRIVEVAAMPEFAGKIIFLQNYDMEVARRMVQGVDVWMNTPTRPLEASGTSGEKAVMNGVLHFSVLDGWWVEGYKENAGWMLPMERTFDDQRRQDELDAETIYTIIEESIAPAYYNRDKDGVSSQWVSYIKNSIADVASNFTTKRMIEDYQSRFYEKLRERSEKLMLDNYSEARTIAAWKRRVSRQWNTLRVIESKTYDVSKEAIVTGNMYKTEVVIDPGELKPEDIGVELVMAESIVENSPVDVIEVQPLTLIENQNGQLHYMAELSPRKTGAFDVAVRIYAHNDKLPNRMDFALVKWC